MSDTCPACGGTSWATASDGLGTVASVASCCLGCGYFTVSVIDISHIAEDSSSASS